MSSVNSISYTQFLRRLYNEDSDFSLKSEARENEVREHIPVPYDNIFQSIPVKLCVTLSKLFLVSFP